MEIKGEHRFNAPRDRVWDTMLSAESLRAAIPGCETLTETGERAYDMTLKVGIAAIRGTYSGTVHVTDITPRDSYRLAVTGSGRPGSVQGNGLLALAEDGTGTIVRYDGEVKAQGALARLGNRLLGGAAKLLIGQFMSGMEKEVARQKG